MNSHKRFSLLLLSLILTPLYSLALPLESFAQRADRARIQRVNPSNRPGLGFRDGRGRNPLRGTPRVGSVLQVPNRSLSVSNNLSVSFGFLSRAERLLNPSSLLTVGSGSAYLFPCTASSSLVASFPVGNASNGQCLRGIRVTTTPSSRASTNSTNLTGWIESQNLHAANTFGKSLLTTDNQDLVSDVSTDEDPVEYYCNALARNGSGWRFSSSQNGWDVFSPNDPCARAIQQCEALPNSNGNCFVANTGFWSIIDPDVTATVNCGSTPPIIERLTGRELGERLNRLQSELNFQQVVLNQRAASSCGVSIVGSADVVVAPADAQPSLIRASSSETGISVKALDGDVFVTSAIREGRQYRLQEGFEYVYTQAAGGSTGSELIQPIENLQQEFQDPLVTDFLTTEWQTTNPGLVNPLLNEYRNIANGEVPPRSGEEREEDLLSKPGEQYSIVLPSEWKWIPEPENEDDLESVSDYEAFREAYDRLLSLLQPISNLQGSASSVQLTQAQPQVKQYYPNPSQTQITPTLEAIQEMIAYRINPETSSSGEYLSLTQSIPWSGTQDNFETLVGRVAANIRANRVILVEEPSILSLAVGEAAKFQIQAPRISSYTVYMFRVDGKVYFMSFFTGEPVEPEVVRSYIPEFEAIAQTLRIIQSNQTGQTPVF